MAEAQKGPKFNIHITKILKKYDINLVHRKEMLISIIKRVTL